MKIFCEECGAANSPESTRCSLCNAKLPQYGSTPDYGKFDFSADPKPVKDKAPMTYLGWSLLETLCCCSPLAILAIVFGAQSAYAFKHKDYDKAERKSEAARKTVLWALVLAFILWIIIFASGVLDKV